MFKQPFLLGAAASAALSSACGSEPKTVAPDDVVDGAIVDGTNVSDVDSGAPYTWNSCNPPCADAPPIVGEPCGGFYETDCPYYDGFTCNQGKWQLEPDTVSFSGTGTGGSTSTSSDDGSDAGVPSGAPSSEAGAPEQREAGLSEAGTPEAGIVETGTTGTLEAGVAETATTGTAEAGTSETDTLDANVGIVSSTADGG